MSKGRRLSEQHIAFIKAHYVSRGAPYCATATGLKITAIWGAAHRLHLTKPDRRRQHHAEHRDSGRQTGGYGPKHYDHHAVAAALTAWTATTPTTPEPPPL